MRKTLLIVFAAVILMGIGVLFLRRWGLNTFGTGYDPNKRQDVRKLIVIADDSRPVRESLERFRHDQGRYPEVLSNLFPTYLHATNSPGDFTDWNGWRYEGASNSYTLRYQVNWDEGFFCEHQASGTDDWYYSSSASGVTDLTPEFDHR